MSKLFHHNKKGNILWAVAVYGFFWFIFYGSMLVMPMNWLVYLYSKFGGIMVYYNLFIVPGLSLLLPILVQKRVRVKLWFLYAVHLLAMFVLIFIFISLFESRIFDTPLF